MADLESYFEVVYREIGQAENRKRFDDQADAELLFRGMKDWIIDYVYVERVLTVREVLRVPKDKE